MRYLSTDMPMPYIHRHVYSLYRPSRCPSPSPSRSRSRSPSPSSSVCTCGCVLASRACACACTAHTRADKRVGHACELLVGAGTGAQSHGCVQRARASDAQAGNTHVGATAPCMSVWARKVSLRNRMSGTQTTCRRYLLRIRRWVRRITVVRHRRLVRLQ